MSERGCCCAFSDNTCCRITIRISSGQSKLEMRIGGHPCIGCRATWNFSTQSSIISIQHIYLALDLSIRNILRSIIIYYMHNYWNGHIGASKVKFVASHFSSIF
ncbi:hypothetical protein D3C72_1041050 [compost metagenome]